MLRESRLQVFPVSCEGIYGKKNVQPIPLSKRTELKQGPFRLMIGCSRSLCAQCHNPKTRDVCVLNSLRHAIQNTRIQYSYLCSCPRQKRQIRWLRVQSWTEKSNDCRAHSAFQGHACTSLAYQWQQAPQRGAPRAGGAVSWVGSRTAGFWDTAHRVFPRVVHGCLGAPRHDQ